MRPQRRHEPLLKPLLKPHAQTRLRLDLEAKLLAYRCGWLACDEIKVRKLERDLGRILDSAGEDQLARQLIGR
jgi:hypothetical protein